MSTMTVPLNSIKKPLATTRMADVARQAGVSVMTVSRALKPGTNVAPGTRERVLQTVREMGYVPDLLAGGLSSKRSGFVSLLVPSVNNPHFAETVMGMKRVLEPAGLQVLLGFTNYQAHEEERLIEWMLKRRPQALVLTYDGHSERARQLLAGAGIPVIELWEKPSRPIGHVVGFSNRDAACDMTRALIGQGYQKIAYIGEADDHGTRGDQRRKGFTDAMKAAGLDDSRQLAYGAPPISMARGRAAFEQLMTLYPDTQAVLCVSDPCAFGALTFCLEHHWPVPERVAIAGFGAFEISACSVPAISTLSVNGAEVGEKAGQLILDLLETSRLASPLPFRTIDILTQPILRASTTRT
jgi:LacI family transcriptional regulator, gluconate utilization system Gnt-I transcriptional repressor